MDATSPAAILRPEPGMTECAAADGLTGDVAEEISTLSSHAVLAPPLLPEQPVQDDVGEAVAVVGLLALDAFEHEAAAFG